MSASLWVLVVMICISMFLFYKIPETFVNVDPEEYVTVIPNFLTRDECESLAAAAMTKSLEDSEVGGGTETDPSKLDLDSRRSKQTWFVGGEHPVSDKLREKPRSSCPLVRHLLVSILPRMSRLRAIQKAGTIIIISTVMTAQTIVHPTNVSARCSCI